MALSPLVIHVIDVVLVFGISVFGLLVLSCLASYR
jgi:hypothetical protein